MTSDQRKIRELENRIKRIELEKEILKKGYRALDLRHDEQFTLIDQLKPSYKTVMLCDTFGVHRSSYKYWLKRSKSVSLKYGCASSMYAGIFL